MIHHWINACDRWNHVKPQPPRICQLSDEVGEGCCRCCQALSKINFVLVQKHRGTALAIGWCCFTFAVSLAGLDEMILVLLHSLEIVFGGKQDVPLWNCVFLQWWPAWSFCQAWYDLLEMLLLLASSTVWWMVKSSKQNGHESFVQTLLKAWTWAELVLSISPAISVRAGAASKGSTEWLKCKTKTKLTKVCSY